MNAANHKKKKIPILNENKYLENNKFEEDIKVEKM